MAKIKFTKNEQKKQQDALKQFQRFLPTLQLKKQQLQSEVRKSSDLLESNLSAQRALRRQLSAILAFYGDAETMTAVEAQVKIREVRRGTVNIAGLAVPIFERVIFEPCNYDLYVTGWFFDDAVAALKEAVTLREAYKVLEVQYRLLSAELRTTSQRVNLFEKVKIPECKENIRRIGIMLGDLNASAVARSKIAKRIGAAAAAAV